MSKRAFYYTTRGVNGVSLLTSTGRRNDTQIAKFQGLGGSRKESSWNRETFQHDCCGAKVSWRHKVNCNRKGRTGVSHGV